VEPPPVLVAPDRFASDLRAPQVAAAIGRGLERAGLRPPDLCPVAGGGPGTVEALLPVLGGEARPGFALIEDGATALTEELDGIAPAAAAGAAVVVVAAGGRPPPDRLALGRARLVVLAPGRAAAAWAARGAVLEPGPAWVLDLLDFDARMRAARAVITGEARLDRGTLGARCVGEIGTRCRQAGVPLHAIVGEDAASGFDKRIIDLQRVLVAGTLGAIEAAAEQLGAELAAGRA
jgi:glycerate kinase